MSPQCSLTDEAPIEGRRVVIPKGDPGTRRSRVMVDPDIDEYLDANTDVDADTNTPVPLTQVDKGKGKAQAINPNEESPKVR